MSAQVFDRVYVSDIEIVALTRHGGHSLVPYDSLNLANYVGDDAKSVAANQASVASLVSANGVAVMNSDHGRTVHVVDAAGPAASGDGLVTRTANLALLALAADCVPFALADPINRVIAIGHAGWRWVIANVMEATIHAFVAEGGQLDSTHAVIGPAICARCYEVPAERVEMFRQTQGAAVADDTHLDLTAGVYSELHQFVNQVQVIAGCTQEDPNLFSYRRSAGVPTGRGGLVIAMPSS
jgi:YfiH family protein